MLRRYKSKIALFAVIALYAAPCFSQLANDSAADSANDSAAQKLPDGFVYRNLGPFRTGQWIGDVAVPDQPEKAHLYTIYAASRNGGIWKTTNAGTTWQHIFDEQNVLSIGCIAVAPSNENIVWVGTGDASMTRISYPGDGIYKSIDSGNTWSKMGMADSEHIARIVIDPRNPDIVYAAVMGHEFSANEERGVFKTTDGGKTWNKILYLDEKTGAIDLVINRQRPEILYAALYEKQRLPWKMDFGGGPESGIYKTSDSGKTWHKLGGGLPTGNIGRIGLDLYQKDGNLLYAIVENGNMRPPTEKEIKTAQQNKQEAKEREFRGEVWRTHDAGRTWTKMNSVDDDMSGKAAYSFNQIRVDQNQPDHIIATGVNLADSRDGGKTWTGLSETPDGIFQKAFGDFRTAWIDPQNSDRILAGSDGGLFISYDGGKSCDYFMNIAMGGEWYGVTYDMEKPYNVYGGLQDHESWKGASNGKNGEITLENWSVVGIGDGMYNAVDPGNSRWVFNTAEWGQQHRLDQETLNYKEIVPPSPVGQPPLRWNWTPPLIMSPHNSQILYTGAQIVFRTLDRGDHWQPISPDLTRNDSPKISPPGSTIQYCTITTLSESPITPGLLWVGADDGTVQVSRDGGANWTNVTVNLAKAGAPDDGWVTRVVASRYAPGTAYVTKSRLRFDDFRPFVYVTTDFGASWTSISAGLPQGSVNVIVEDTAKPDMLFVGAVPGVYFSRDRGKNWMRIKANMPNVPVQDIAIQPRDSDLIVATFGRGLWIMNVTPLRELTDAVTSGDAYFFRAYVLGLLPGRHFGNSDLYGDRYPSSPNEPPVTFTYYLRNAITEKGKVKIVITDAAGNAVKELQAEGKAGINTVGWDLVGSKSHPLQTGDYTATLHAGDKELTQRVHVSIPDQQDAVTGDDLDTD
jgi:photosystem II stability/assembly factor-like uncharacterized protein